jgi:hypothetical protein
MQKEHHLSKNKDELAEIKMIKFDLIINVFRYIHAKDIFEAHYTKFLSKRLISKRSESQE